MMQVSSHIYRSTLSSNSDIHRLNVRRMVTRTAFRAVRTRQKRESRNSPQVTPVQNRLRFIFAHSSPHSSETFGRKSYQASQSLLAQPHHTEKKKWD